MTRPTPETRAVLDGIDAFADLPQDLLSTMWERMEERSFVPGDVLMRQQDPGDRLLVLVKGSADVSAKDQEGVVRRIGEVHAGEVVGEMALITGEQRGADVVATENVLALSLDADEFHRLAHQHPVLGVVLTNLIADRLGRADWDILGGKMLDGYRILQCVGRGGMAVVYEARESDGDRRVALKMMSHRLVYDATALSRFRQEADIVKSLEQENIARLYGGFSAYGTHFLVMEFLDGPSLDDLVKPRKPIDEKLVKPIIGQLSAALTYVHGQGLLHRDIKPGNVMLTRDGVVKLMDFGLAKPLVHIDDRTVTNEMSLVGTPSYMAPEQLSGDELDPRVDIYALACVAYTMLTGEKPFDTNNLLELVRRKLAFVVPPAEQIGAGVSSEMFDFLNSSLRASRDDRLASLDRYVPWARPIDLSRLRT